MCVVTTGFLLCNGCRKPQQKKNNKTKIFRLTDLARVTPSGGQEISDVVWGVLPQKSPPSARPPSRSSLAERGGSRSSSEDAKPLRPRGLRGAGPNLRLPFDLQEAGFARTSSCPRGCSGLCKDSGGRATGSAGDAEPELPPGRETELEPPRPPAPPGKTQRYQTAQHGRCSLGLCRSIVPRSLGVKGVRWAKGGHSLKLHSK